MEPANDKLLLEAFAKVLRLERRKAGFSQEELAHLAGTSLRYISLLENCKHQPSLSTIKGLCDGLGIKMTDLIIALEEELA